MTEAERIAALRNKDAPSTRALSPDYDRVGALGELHFSELSGLPMDKTRRVHGDHGVDFTRWDLTIDVKTLRHPYSLLVERNKVYADVFVLMGVDKELTKAYVVGWTLFDAVLMAPITKSRYGIWNHTVPARELRPLESLFRALRLPLEDTSQK